MLKNVFKFPKQFQQLFFLNLVLKFKVNSKPGFVKIPLIQMFCFFFSIRQTQKGGQFILGSHIKNKGISTKGLTSL